MRDVRQVMGGENFEESETWISLRVTYNKVYLVEEFGVARMMK